MDVRKSPCKQEKSDYSDKLSNHTFSNWVKSDCSKNCLPLMSSPNHTRILNSRLNLYPDA